MKRRLCLIGAMTILCLSAFSAPAMADEMTFQIVNDTDVAMSYKLFSHGETRRQWPSKTKAYSVSPGTDVQQVKIDCDVGEKICWGAWTKTQRATSEIVGANGERHTRSTTYNAGVGERGQRTCEKCCHICKDGAVVPAATLHGPSTAGR